MNKKIKVLFIIITIISTILMASNIVLAEDENTQNENTQTESTSSENISSGGKSNENAEPTSTQNKSVQNKSTSNQTKASSSTAVQTTSNTSNANLSNLGIKPNDFSGFKPATTTYNVTVPENIQEVEVYAKPQSTKATVSGTGKVSLNSGKNTVNVVVTAEDGKTTKTYTLNITRDGEATNEESENTTSKGNGLSSLKIGDLKLSPEFSTNIYEYTTTYIGEGTELEIEGATTDPSYIVEITGNKDLKEGENTITILVSDENSNNVATYQVIVNKKLIDEEALAREQEEMLRTQARNKKIIMLGIVAIIVIVLILLISFIVRRRRERNYADYYEDDYEDDYEENYEENYEDDYEENYQENYEDNYEENSKKGKYKGKRFK